MIPLLLNMMFVGVLASSNAAPVTVQPVLGTELSGSLVRLDSQTAVVRIDAREQSFSLRNLRSIIFRHSNPDSANTVSQNRSKVRVRLIDGSMIVAAQYTAEHNQARVELGGRIIKIPTRSIESVRFHPPAKKLDAQWQENTQGEVAGDLVIVRRSDTSLDQLEGILHDVTPTTVNFEFEDETIPVKRTKLEGIVYVHPKHSAPSGLVGTVVETNGSRWCAKAIALQFPELRVTTNAGITVNIALSEIARIDFAASNIVYLSDLEPEAMEWTPFVRGRRIADELVQMYRPRRDRSFDGPELWVGPIGAVTRCSKGLSIHSRTLLTYRLEGKYRKFLALAGIDSRLHGRGNVELTISGDDKELFRKTIAGGQAPVPLDLDVAGVQRLRILVDFGQAADVADHLNLCEARLIK